MTPKTITLPVAPGHWALLQAEWPITEAEWAQMHRVLEAMRPNLVESYADTLIRLGPTAVAAAYEATFSPTREGRND